MEEYSYTAPWTMYSFSLAESPELTVALASFVETQHNAIQVLQVQDSQLECVAEAPHQYPPSKVMWNPRLLNVLASAGDALRIWNFNRRLELKSTLVSGDHAEFPPPLTSLDWNPCEDWKVATSSVNTTCAVWDANRERAITQLIAHDKEVYDIAFANDPHVFATVAGDGSVRQFDLRDLSESAILYERQDITPCLRLGWNGGDSHYIAVIIMDMPFIAVIDRRQLSKPCFQLTGHQACVNSLAWSPTNHTELLTGSDDYQALVWRVQDASAVQEPSLVCTADQEITYVQWTANSTIGLGHSKRLKVLFST